jgi:hypothetical protein
VQLDTNVLFDAAGIMSEHWKSTPKYWCKHCSCYVRDTKLERQNHEATARHQGALKRFLRDLHRGHDREEREKDRARQEIERLNGVISGPSGTSSAPSSVSRELRHRSDARPTASELNRQREQLVELGVSVPSDFRPEIALPGEWTVTHTRIIEENASNDSEKSESKATGVRKRDTTEEQKEEEEAIRGLFKKPRRWGRDTKAMPDDNDAELETLLSGTFPSLSSTDEHNVKTEPVAQTQQDIKTEQQEANLKEIKNDIAVHSTGLPEEPGSLGDGSVKAEEDLGNDPDHIPPNIVFKKRKAKGIRHR